MKRQLSLIVGVTACLLIAALFSSDSSMLSAPISLTAVSQGAPTEAHSPSQSTLAEAESRSETEELLGERDSIPNLHKNTSPPVETPVLAAAKASESPWVKGSTGISLDHAAFLQGDNLKIGPYIFSALSSIPVSSNISQSISYRGELLNAAGEVTGSATITGTTTSDPDNISYSGRLELYTGETFTIETDRERNVLLTEVDSELYPDCGQRVNIPGNSSAGPIHEAHQTHPVERKLSIIADTDSSSSLAGNTSPATIAADNTVIDVMVVYTNNAETAIGTVNDVETLAAAAIASTNTAYSNSGINITLNLVHVASAGYSDSGDFTVDLNRLTLTNDGFMDNIHALRTIYGADMVVLLNNSNAYCGLGWMMTDLNAGYSGYMFTVVYHACAVGNLSFAHELGHNMGADHDRDNGSGGLYNYSYGHRFGGSRSVMAYAPGTRVSYFSNPDVSYLGQPTGIAAGDLNSADNVSTLNSSAAMIAGFKSAVTYSVSGTVSLSGQPLSGVSINGGGLGTTSSNGSGNYSFSGLANGSNYSLTPSRYGYTFTPSSVSGTISAANATRNFTATKVNYSLSGRVTISGTGLGSLTVNGGGLGTTTTDSNGNYSFNSVPYLTAYNISISAPANSTFTTTVLTGSTTGTLSSLNFSGSCNAPAYLLNGVCQTDGTSPPTDSDGDGISDAQEIILGLNPSVPDSDSDGVTDGQELTDGTDPLDRGSAHIVLSTTVCGEWNGFLGGMYNILEHVNMSSHQLNISSTLYNLNGESKSNYNFGLNPGAQFDLLVHDLQGRDLNSIGQVCSTHNGNEGDLDGRMIYYKLSSTPGETFDFAFALPFTNSTKGTQFVPFNTYQPSLDPVDAANPVANWIQLTNSGVSYKTGILTFYDMTGQILNSLSVSIPGGARRDFSGHQFGASLVGLVKWQPDDNGAPFQLRNIRYIYNNPNWQDNFSAAFQLSGAIGSGRQLFTPLDTASSSAILEVSNTSSQAENVTANIRNSAGVVLKTITFSLPAYGSRHIVTDEFLAGSYGSADIRGTRKGTLIAVAMQYKRTPTGGISSMYGIKGREAMGSVMKSSYNTYLGQSCKLSAVNTKSSSQTLTLNMVGWDGAEILSPTDPRATLTLPAYGTTEIDICAFDSANNYGVVTLQSSTANSIVGSVVRTGANDEYRFPTPLRE